MKTKRISDIQKKLDALRFDIELQKCVVEQRLGSLDADKIH